MNKLKKDITQYKEIKKIETYSVTYLFKLNDGRICVTTNSKEMHIFTYINENFIKQITIPNYSYFIIKIIQLKNDLIIFPTINKDINLVKVFEESYKIQYSIKFNEKIFEKFQKYISFIELENTNQIAVLVSDFTKDKLLIYNITDSNYNLTTIIILLDSKFDLSLNIVEISKINQIAYQFSRGLYFYDLKNFEIKNKMNNIRGFEWTNTMILYKEDYLIIGSIFLSNNENEKGLYLVKCSTYEIIDSIFSNDLDYMYCTAIKILNDDTILCGFHMYDYYSSYVHIKMENDKIKIINIKRLGNNSKIEYEGEILGIEQINNVIIAGNEVNSIYLYKYF